MKTYRTLRGLIIMHQRVQMAPVPIRAAFWVRESFSAGRVKSAIPAMTRHHYKIRISFAFFHMYPSIPNASPPSVPK